MSNGSNFLKKISIENFKSFEKIEIELEQISIFIGANGSGKSNFISFFKLLKSFETNFDISSSILNFGGPSFLLNSNLIKNNHRISGELQFLYDPNELNRWENYYKFELNFDLISKSCLIDEWICTINRGNKNYINQQKEDVYKKISSSKTTSKFYSENSKNAFKTLKIDSNVKSMLDKAFYYLKPKLDAISLYHFHDVGITSNLKVPSDIGMPHYLLENGQNLAMVLYQIREQYPEIYKKILINIRHVAPYFDDFILELKDMNQTKLIFLNWKNKNVPNFIFSVHSLSDGTLRYIALLVALFDPFKLERTIIIDVPELGLHPYALEMLVEVIKESSLNNQIIIATQNPILISKFELSNLYSVEYSKKGTAIKKVSEDEKMLKLAKELMEDGETISDLWIQNILGGNIKW